MACSTNDTSFTTISHSVMEVEIKGIDLMILKLVHLIEVAKFAELKSTIQFQYSAII